MDDIRNGTCPLCKRHEVIEADLQETDREGYPSPLPLAWSSLPGGQRWHPEGLLKAYVCRRCGRTELFAEAPHTIPIGRQYRTRIIERPPGGPFR